MVYSLNFLLDDEVEFDIIVKLLTDLLDNWTQLNLSTRISLCDFTKSALIAFYNFEGLELDPTVVFKSVLSGFLYATGTFYYMLQPKYII
jgi:hypothetical protein